MDPKFLIDMLFETHVQVTLSEPFKHIIVINNLNHIKFNAITSSNTDYNEFGQVVYNKYNALHLPYGSVDCDPNFWLQICLKVIKQNAEVLGTITYSIPNGCCTMPNCYINKFYNIIARELET